MPLPENIVLNDPRIVARKAPYTYFLPPAPLIPAINVEDLVQLVFAAQDQKSIERMWVEVVDVDGKMLTGKLVNHPTQLTELAYGNIVEFDRNFALDVQIDEVRMPAYEPPKQYWERCLVDDCVLHGRSRVDYLYRETPNLTKEGDNDPDSGWRIRGTEEETAKDDAADRRIHYVALGKVLNQDDSWLPLIDNPPGFAYQRIGDSDEYETFENPDLIEPRDR